MKKLIVLFYVMIFSGSGWAQNLDNESALALQQTIELLSDSSQLEDLINSNSAAANADSVVGQLVSGDEEKRAQVYALSASIMTALVNGSNGDVNKMNDIVSQLKANPVMIVKYLSPKDMIALQELAKGLEAK